MPRLARILKLAVALCACAAALAACGGGGSGTTAGVPELVGTEIPTAVQPPPTPPTCAPPANLSLPSAFPNEVRSIVPPDFVVWSVQTSPNLIVVGRSMPSNDTGKNEPLYGILAADIRSKVTALGWPLRINVQVSLTDTTATAPDGRVLHFFTGEQVDCPGQVRVVFDLQWIKG
jgi:hypothetical protein